MNQIENNIRAYVVFYSISIWASETVFNAKKLTKNISFLWKMLTFVKKQENLN